MNIQHLSAYLPAQVSAQGASCGQLQGACRDHVLRPQEAPSPYPDSLPHSDGIDWSRNIGKLAGAAQSEFRNQVGDSGAQLRVPQLQQSLSDLSQGKMLEADHHRQEISQQRTAYWSQVGRTAGWMGLTLGSLAVTGILPNPVSAGVALVSTGMCVKSLATSRESAQKLSERLPQLQSAARLATQVGAEAGQMGVWVGAWGDLLDPPQAQEQQAA